jgi:hypothetical protein
MPGEPEFGDLSAVYTPGWFPSPAADGRFSWEDKEPRMPRILCRFVLCTLILAVPIAALAAEPKTTPSPNHATPSLTAAMSAALEHLWRSVATIGSLWQPMPHSRSLLPVRGAHSSQPAASRLHRPIGAVSTTCDLGVGSDPNGQCR